MTPEIHVPYLHDFANEGDCPTCGHLKAEIDAGTAKPCFEWERIELPASHRFPPEPIPEPTESKTPNVTPWEEPR